MQNNLSEMNMHPICRVSFVVLFWAINTLPLPNNLHLGVLKLWEILPHSVMEQYLWLSCSMFVSSCNCCRLIFCCWTCWLRLLTCSWSERFLCWSSPVKNGKCDLNNFNKTLFESHNFSITSVQWYYRTVKYKWRLCYSSFRICNLIQTQKWVWEV